MHCRGAGQNGRKAVVDRMYLVVHEKPLTRTAKIVMERIEAQELPDRSSISLGLAENDKLNKICL